MPMLVVVSTVLIFELLVVLLVVLLLLGGLCEAKEESDGSSEAAVKDCFSGDQLLRDDPGHGDHGQAPFRRKGKRERGRVSV